MSFRETPAREVIAEIARRGNLNIIIDKSVTVASLANYAMSHTTKLWTVFCSSRLAESHTGQ